MKKVKVDSRLVTEGDLFFALKGAKVDGHDFIQEAGDKGAVAAVVDRTRACLKASIPLIPVSDVLATLQAMARGRISQLATCKVIGVTGSVGKTTTKDFITTLLAQEFNVASSLGNANSQIGLPLTILNDLNGSPDFLVLEYSMTHPGNIRDLVNIVVPDIALLNNACLVHSANFDSVLGIAMAKSEIFENSKTKVGIVHGECPGLERVLQVGSCEKRVFSLQKEKAPFTLRKLGNELLFKGLKGEVVLPLIHLPGEHNMHNLLAALAVSETVGLTHRGMQQGVLHLKLPKLRFEEHHLRGIHFVNDSYNASPEGVKSALKALPDPKAGGRKIFAFSEMKELGKFSEQCHKEVGQVALQYVEELVCIGEGTKLVAEQFKHSGKTAFWEACYEDLVKRLKLRTREGDVVLIKGANSAKLWRVIDDFR